MKKTRPVNIFYGHVLVGLLFSLLGLWSATQYVAHALGYQAQLGPPLLVLKGWSIYEPWAWWLWAYHYEPYAPWIFERASWITYGFFAVMVAVMVFLATRRARRNKESGAYGTARWATERDLKKNGLLTNEGVFLGQTYDARYQQTLDKGGSVDWLLEKKGKHILRHDGPEHVFAFAPTRSRKGVGLVIPTLLTWTGSCVVYDIKKENWSITAGWRRQFSHCLRFEPTDPASIRFNPLLEVRKGENEVRDVQNIADILVDPEGSKEKRDHWEKTGHSLLVGSILHVLYAEEEKTLCGVANFLANPGRGIYNTLEVMLNTPHLGDEVHPVVASTAREMFNKSENELSGVVSTAMSFLGLYRDPVIARNTSASDFSIADLMHAQRPVSLYLVVPPSDAERTRPLIRLVLNQIGRRLTERMQVGTQRNYKHRLLLMLDEFPTLGRLSFFETELAFLAGYGIRAYLIAQSLNQIEKAYGPNNSILDNSHIRITYGALDERTAERISKMLGQATERRKQLNLAGNRLAPWLGHVMESEQESPRALLTPGEVLQLPGDEALVIVGGMPPYRAKKIMYYQDDRLKDRAFIPAPDSAQEQGAELIGTTTSPWDELPAVLGAWVSAEAAPIEAPTSHPPQEQEGLVAAVPDNPEDQQQKELDLEIVEAAEIEQETAELSKQEQERELADEDARRSQEEQMKIRRQTQRGRTMEISRDDAGGGLPL